MILEAISHGFNGREEDDEAKGDGNQLDFGDRAYDPRVGRWLSVDKLYHAYPFASPYIFALNTPIQAMDPDGQKVLFVNGYYNTGILGRIAGKKGGESYWGIGFISWSGKWIFIRLTNIPKTTQK